MTTRFKLTDFDRYRIKAAREALAAAETVNMLDANAMASLIGLLEVVLAQMVEMTDEASEPVAPRCPAAHPEDLTPCGGPVVVTILDPSNAGADGCEHHASRLLASITGGRPVAKPDAPAAVALRIFRSAHHTRPYPWREGQS